MADSADMRDELQPSRELMVDAFVARWQSSAASERSNYQLFLIELCEMLGVGRPEPATGEPERDQYVFERPVYFRNADESTSTGLIDLYRHASFVLETKQGCEAKLQETLLQQTGLRSRRRRRGHGVRGTGTWDTAMLRAGYTKSLCFDPFPFPDCTEREQGTIAAIAEELDALRKERLRLHPDLTLTGLYNVLAKLRSGEPLTAAERGIHDRGLIGVLWRLHDALDRAVLAAYGWASDLGDDDLLSHLVNLNRERAEEEWRGKIRWLRPEFQAGFAAAPVQRELVVAAATQVGRQSWPKELPEQFKAVRDALAAQGTPARAEQVAAQFCSRAPGPRRRGSRNARLAGTSAAGWARAVRCLISRCRTGQYVGNDRSINAIRKLFSVDKLR